MDAQRDAGSTPEPETKMMRLHAGVLAYSASSSLSETDSTVTIAQALIAEQPSTLWSAQRALVWFALLDQHCEVSLHAQCPPLGAPVSTSTPSLVMRTVCSNWAAKEPSFVTCRHGQSQCMCKSGSTGCARSAQRAFRRILHGHLLWMRSTPLLHTPASSHHSTPQCAGCLVSGWAQW
jgi:hypothetical protein